MTTFKHTGIHDFTDATPSVPTEAPGTSTTQAASTAFVAQAIAARLNQQFDAYVDATGTYTGSPFYTTLAAALAAISAGGRIAILSDLTQTAAGQFDIGKTCTIDFMGHQIVSTATGADCITSGLAYASTSFVNGVKIYNLGGISRQGGGRGGTAINLHGTQSWTIMPAGQDSTIANFDVGVLFDANPVPNGDCFHNKVGGSPHRFMVADCGVAVKNTNTANDNEAGVWAYNCDQALLMDSGLSLYLPHFSFEATTTNGTGATQINMTGGSGLTITGLYGESLTSDPQIYINGTGVRIDGVSNLDTSGNVLQLGSTANQYDINLNQRQLVSGKIETVSFEAQSASVQTVALINAPINALYIRRVDVIPDAAIAYVDASNRWTAELHDYTGPVDLGVVGTVYTQAATIQLGGITFAGLPFKLLAGHTLRLKLTKTGAPGTNWFRSIVEVRQDDTTTL